MPKSRGSGAFWASQALLGVAVLAFFLLNGFWWSLPFVPAGIAWSIYYMSRAMKAGHLEIESQ